MQSERALLVILVILLQGIGLVMIYDASAIFANESPAIHDSDFFLKRQLVWVGLGAAAFGALCLMDYRVLVRNALPIFGVSLVSLGMVFLPGIGVEANGSHRWIRLGGKIFQPSEVAKLSCILFLAHALTRGQGRSPLTIKKLLFPLGGIAVCAGLILLEPNLSSTGVLGSIGFIVLFVSGLKLRYLLCLTVAGLGGLAYKVYTSSYQFGRILAYLDPIRHESGIAYQQTHSLLALGTGGLFGLGLGAGRQKLGFLPYLYNDFVGASVGEQVGFIGMCVLISLFVILVVLGFRIATRARQFEGYLVATGVSSLIALETILHLGVVTSLLPATGLNLPFVSFGGSNLFVTFLGVGLLMSISRVAEKEPATERPRALRVRAPGRRDEPGGVGAPRRRGAWRAQGRDRAGGQRVRPFVS
ncbi:MAG: putative peptidoglycan glycosyltransferase FtsW [bacterium]|nr:putative peptidoglycan glycosyltransferase FtsW [bacterium]